MKNILADIYPNIYKKTDQLIEGNFDKNILML